MNSKNIKLTLEAARVNAGYKQTEAARKLGITQSTLSSWEKNSTKLSYLDAINIGKVYGIPPDMLFFGNKNEFIRSNKEKNQLINS